MISNSISTNPGNTNEEGLIDSRKEFSESEIDPFRNKNLCYSSS